MTDIDVSLLDVGFRAVYAREGWIPLAAGEDGTILVGASRELNPAQGKRSQTILAHRSRWFR